MSGIRGFQGIGGFSGGCRVCVQDHGLVVLKGPCDVKVYTRAPKQRMLWEVYIVCLTRYQQSHCQKVPWHISQRFRDYQACLDNNISGVARGPGTEVGEDVRL